MNLVIREATMDDAEDIVRLIKELAESEECPCTLTTSYTRQVLINPGSSVFLAEVDGKVQGLISISCRPNLFHAGPSASIDEMVVAEEVRSLGIGSALLEAVLSRLGKQKCAEVSVTTMQDNLDAVRFYKSHGLVDEALYLEKHFE